MGAEGIRLERGRREGKGKEGGEPRQLVAQFWITFKELQSQWSDWIPLRREEERVGKKGGGGVRGRKRGNDKGRREKSAKRNEDWVVASFPLFRLVSSLCLSLCGMHALALHTEGYTLMIYLCAGAGRHGKSGLHKSSAVPAWSPL